MEYYIIYNIQNKRLYDGCATWYDLITYIKARGLEEYLYNGSSAEEATRRDIVVMTEDLIQVSHEEVLASLPKVSIPNNTPDTLSPETRYGSKFYKYAWRKYSNVTYRFRQTPCTSGTGRWVKGSSYRCPKKNKKYWADLQEYYSIKKEDYWSPWYDDYSARPRGKDWKRCKKKKQWM